LQDSHDVLLLYGTSHSNGFSAGDLVTTLSSALNGICVTVTSPAPFTPALACAVEMAAEDLDHLYSPSRWSKKFPADTIVDHHIETVLEGTWPLPCEVWLQFSTKSTNLL